MQVEKNQRVISFHIREANFLKNLNLEVSLRIIQF